MAGGSRERSSDKLDRLFRDIESAVDGTGKCALVLAADVEEGALIREQLEPLGYDVTVTRSKGAAIDLLTHRQFDVLVSEFEVWGDEGRALFAPSSGTGDDPPAQGVAVIFYGDARDGFPERALRIGAAEAMTRPLVPAVIVKSVHSAVRREGTALALPPGELDLGIAAPEPPSPTSTRAAAPMSADRPATPADAKGRGGTGGISAAELAFDPVPWWRFFFEVRIRLRREADPQRRQFVFLNCFRECLEPAALVLVEFERGGLRCFFGESGPRDPGALDPAAARAWAKLLAQVYLSDPRPDTLRVADADGGVRRRLFLALLGPKSRPLPPAMIDEVREVLAAVPHLALADSAEALEPLHGA